MVTRSVEKPRYKIKEPKNLSARIQWLRDFYFQGNQRKWNNEFIGWTSGTNWDIQFQEGSYYIVPETYAFFDTFKGAFRQTSKKIELAADFWKWSLPERYGWFVREVMVKYMPQEILPGDLLAGGRFNIQTSMCQTKEEAREFEKLVYGKGGSRERILWFHNHGYGNTGATSGHLIPDYPRVLKEGWKSIFADVKEKYESLSESEKQSPKGGQLRAMLISATTAQGLAQRYSQLCRKLADEEKNAERKAELLQMAKILERVPWEPARDFWEAVQSLWLTHMLVMSEENYPGPGTSFGRIDQYLYPFWQASIKSGMDREWGKEILKCFWVHANTAYDAMIRTNGNQGITAGFGQLITLSGIGKDGKDMTNDLTYVLLEVIDEMSPILEPKPNVRLHRGTPDKLYDTVIGMIASSQGAPFLLNFDERSMAGMILQARKADMQDLINKNNVFEYAPVGCLENTMCGNDRSGTVDSNLDLLKAVELALTGGFDMLPVTNAISGKTEKLVRSGPVTGDPRKFTRWEEFWQAYAAQTRYIISKCVEIYQQTDEIRAQYYPSPYLSCLVRGCAEKGLDLNQGGAQINLTTLEAVTYATTVDSLLAIKYLVFDKKICSMEELIAALKDNWDGHAVLQAQAINKAPKYGRDEDEADALALQVMKLWCEETWMHKTSTGRQFRPGMLSWNYWVSDGYISPASADGRPKGKFLSNAICPTDGADLNGPTAVVNSVGKVLGGKSAKNKGDWEEFNNLLPNGASHTMTFSPALLRDPEHKEKFKAFLKGYVENGGTALQINILDADLLRDAQQHPENYRSLLVRVTGYNAYFTAIGRELQNEIIARESHKM